MSTKLEDNEVTEKEMGPQDHEDLTTKKCHHHWILKQMKSTLLCVKSENYGFISHYHHQNLACCKYIAYYIINWRKRPNKERDHVLN